MSNKEPFYFHQLRRVHFVGIKGIAMAALAVWAKERGIEVLGSDLDEEFPSDEVLAKAGISVLSGFGATHITKDIDLVIYTGAHGGVENIEVKTALELEIRVLPHGKALGLAMKGSTQISVAGSHGKTTTTAMIATILNQGSYAIGCGEIKGLGLPGHDDGWPGRYFVAEADEYVTDPGHDNTPRFLWQTPHILVVTNIDYDHPDVYGSLEEVQQAFLALQKQSSFCIVNLDDPASRPLLEAKHRPKPITYGESEGADFRVMSIAFAPGETSFYLIHKKDNLGQFVIRVPGKHNALNAAAAIVAYFYTDTYGKSGFWGNAETARERILLFGGAKRRFEKIGEVLGVTYYDDYAHHPKEIAATLAAARSWYPGDRIIAVFQPHTYSRTKALLTDFGKAFADADTVITTEIYASARESDTLGITGKTLFAEILKHHRGALYAPDAGAVLGQLQQMNIQKGIVLFMGAGDIYHWEREVIKQLTNNENNENDENNKITN